MLGFADILSGGDRRSVGQSKEVVQEVIRHPRRMGALFECVFHEDETVRMRASDALEKISRHRPDLLQRFSRRLSLDVPKIDQPSVQGHLAQILPRLRLSAIERRRAVAVLKRNLDHYHDWIVVNRSLESLAVFTRKNPRLRRGLIELLPAYVDDHRESVADRAKKLVAEFQAEGYRPKRRRRAQASFGATVRVSGTIPYVELPPDVLNLSSLEGLHIVRVRLHTPKGDRSTEGHPLQNGDPERLKSISGLGRSGWFRTPLVATRNGTMRIYLDNRARDFAGIRANDHVTIVVKRDRGFRTRAIPSALSRRWVRHPDADVGETL